MAFKVTQLVFDDNEDVAEVVARLDAKTGRVLGEMLGTDLKVKTDPEADEHPLAGTDAAGVRTVMARSTALAQIPRDDAVRLFRALDKVDGYDPRRGVTDTVHSSLAHVMPLLDDKW